ncbi:MAG: hypothetical protein COT38_05910 [Candidatus Omnitrophica bacterium CG08_land_8_20_14_0_20_41_16]|uniref:Polymerase nucleotidyl transferase domain-containing protein n=1 Tax=Candidatus Sherwoodlollariibacterium unditelluris TaxID=1974757 RepID=A0A2G9YIV1_9BACT|nr:MAG: hypothetical protein COX41_04405 [Candidatus Omnitrophica bacterium CG23_combo_of_CG06-09_8_20_14_all_41_10]PIS33329.1 MAG: hypothetical protein COT38_05910 [Candidatus Omnitrophica bacterium CG08_land_8_20_14_0_20_41_16]
MQELKIAPRMKKKLGSFIKSLQGIFLDGLISVILYGSAASGEFVDNHSNLNILIVLKDTDPNILKKASKLIRKFPLFQALFLNPGYIERSTDVFPIEFLDMKENYYILFGLDIIKDIKIDLKNLRFQCEQELKAKMLNLRQLYLKLNGNKSALKTILLKSFTSILHIARNVLRLKGKTPAYKKEVILEDLAKEFPLDITIWRRILALRNREEKIRNKEVELLFVSFIREVGKISDIVDRL